MKLLLENWRKYLAERVTDKVFAETVDFLVDALTDPRNFDWKGDEEEEYMGSDLDWDELLDLGLTRRSPVDGEDLAGKTKAMFAQEKPEEPETPPPPTFEFFQVEPRMDENWDRFVEHHPGAAEQLGLDPDKMQFFIVLKVVYGFSEATKTGDRENWSKERDTTTAGLFDGDELIINLKGGRFNISEEQYRKLNENDVLELLRQHASTVRMVVEHEFTHMLNYLRAGKTSPRAKGLKRHHYQRPQKMQKAIRYANSTEEIQARLIPIFKIVQSVGELGQDEIPQTDVNEIAKLINVEAENFSGNKSISNIIKLLYKIYDLHHPAFLDWTSESNKKRLTKRFYEFAQELTSK